MRGREIGNGQAVRIPCHSQRPKRAFYLTGGLETARATKTAKRIELKLVGGMVTEETRIRSPLLSVPETAAYLGMSKDWVYERLKTLIPHVKIGGSLRFRKEDVDRYIASQTVAPKNIRDIRSDISLREVIRDRPRKNRRG